MDKTYNPSDIEARWYQHWEETGAFRCNQRPDAETYSIVIPPPNVTGSLHVGHALNNTLQDILARFERLRGKDVLWQPGTDHAGIATQMVVERQLAEEGKTRHDLGREKFVERVWEWKEESGGTITRQLRRMGSSCDWSRERFTMDDGLSAAVLKVFVQYYREGLIYRDKRLVNWDPKFRTAISDLEVEQREVQGHFWHLRYPIKGEEGRYLEVATTRPETMLGDTAVAVHPEDERYRDLIGKTIILPLVGREIPIIADEHADPEQGSGAVKITPAHDFNDFEVGKRHDLPQVNIFDENAHINENAPEKYRGMDRFEARKAIVADLEAAGVLVKVEDKVIQMPYGDRSGVVIEPWLTDQWYVDAKTLAQPALKAVADGRTTFHPANWKRTYDEWLNNIQPWCISRQLWWGHQIPAWYGPEGSIFVAESEEEAYAEAREKFGGDVVLERDEDVLDTWFSSALWPFSTLGWPEDTEVLRRFYPTSTLITAFDIIFFWVARMMMAGLHYMDEVPFKDVYITSLVRDAQGQKMSKSKGNVIDPLEFIEKYGADALRFTLSSMESQGRDIKLAEDRVAGYRNFGTKLWNATRFAQMNGIGGSDSIDPPEATLTVNKWIIGQVAATARSVTEALEGFRFDAASSAIYHFTWGSFCDWYLELIKPILQADEPDEAAQAETRAVAGWALDQILVLLHPFMPFITEELWHATRDNRATDLIAAVWPTVDATVVDEAAVADIDWVIGFIREVRSTRSEMNVPAGARIPALLVDAPADVVARADANAVALQRLARLSDISPADAVPDSGALALVVDGVTVALPVADVMDLDAERDRLSKSADKVAREIAGLEGRLNNEAFTAKAPEAVVAEARANLADRQATLTKLKEAMARLA